MPVRSLDEGVAFLVANSQRSAPARLMQDSMHLMRTRRFAPLFATQFFGAFNDNLYRTAMVLLVIYGIYGDATKCH